jgi:hypothetical protein
MRTALMVLSLSVAISGSWCFSSAARAKVPFNGPRSISFDARGFMIPTRSASLNLIDGAVTLIGPCGPGRDCDPSLRRNFTLDPQDLVKFRSLAIEVKAAGLLDPVCVERQKREAELADQRDLEAWQKQHPESKGPPPMRVYDPFWASFQVEGVGNVMSTNDYGHQKSAAYCITQATKRLWEMAEGLFRSKKQID